MNVQQMSDLTEVTGYWVECLARLREKNDQKVAYAMAAVVGNPHWDEWYDEGKGDSYFVEIFDLAADLETPIARELSREDAWNRVKKLVAEMSEKYHS